MLRKSIFVLLACVTLTQGQSEFKLGFTHWGDVRAHLVPMQKHDIPRDCNINEGECVGGIPQLLGYIEDTEKNLLTDTLANFRIATGNLISGETGYLSLPDYGKRPGDLKPYADNGWETFGKFLKDIEFQGPSVANSTTFYRPTFMALGVKEFEGGLDYLAKYLSSAEIPPRTLASNINCPADTDFCKKYTKPYGIITSLPGFASIKIGVVGFTDPAGNNHSDPWPASFSDPAKQISDIIKNSELSNSDIKLIIAIGNGNYNLAKQVLRSSEKVKLVIYGGDIQESGNYPVKEGDDGFIAATGLVNDTGTQLGTFKLIISGETGDLIRIENGQLRELISGSVPQDQIAINAIEQLRTGFDNSEVGKSAVKIDGRSCSKNECNLGNLVTDAVVHCAYNNADVNKEKFENIIGIWDAASLSTDVLVAGEAIHIFDIHKWLPLNNKAFLVQLNGTVLWQIFEQGATGLTDLPNWGQFLQVSNGVQVIYKDNQVHKLRVTRNVDGIPTLRDIEKDGIYSVVMPSIVYCGKPVFEFLPGDLLALPPASRKFQRLGLDYECLQAYISALQYISIGFEERIFLHPPEGDESPGSNPKRNLAVTILLTAFITVVVVAAASSVWVFVIQPRRQRKNSGCECKSKKTEHA